MHSLRRPTAFLEFLSASTRARFISSGLWPRHIHLLGIRDMFLPLILSALQPEIVNIHYGFRQEFNSLLMFLISVYELLYFLVVWFTGHDDDRKYLGEVFIVIG